MSLQTGGLLLLPADSPRRWPEPAVHTRDDDFPNLCAGKTDRSTAPRCSRYTFQWPFDRNSNNSTGRTTNIPISINLVFRGRATLQVSTKPVFTFGARALVPEHRKKKSCVQTLETLKPQVPCSARVQGRDLVLVGSWSLGVLTLVPIKNRSPAPCLDTNSLRAGSLVVVWVGYRGQGRQPTRRLRH